MRRIILFVEDFAHEVLLKTLIQRLADLQNISIGKPEIRSARGGHGRVLNELDQYLRDVQRGRQSVPDLLVVGTDSNCKGLLKRRQEVEDVVAKYRLPFVCAIPDPHIERWLLLDSAAFKAVLGKGCDAPDQKCERDRYKHLLINAIRNAGVTPLLGGIEHAEDIVNEMNLARVEKNDESFGKFLKALRDQFNKWSQD
jgi:hypothetical protein